MADDHAKIEIEIALRDAISAGLKSISKEFDGINKQIQQSGGISNTNFGKASEQLVRFREKTNESNRSLTGMNVLLGTMAGLVGLGIIKLFREAAQAVEQFAASRVQLQQFSRTTGFTVTDIENLQQAFKRMGLSVEAGDKAISHFGAMFNDMEIFKTGSQLWTELQKGGPAGTALANRVLELVQAGKRMEAVGEIVTKFDTLTQTSKVALASYLHMTVGELEGLSAALKRNVPPKQYTPDRLKEQKEYHDKYIDMQTHFNQQMDALKQGILETVVDINSYLNKLESDFNKSEFVKRWVQTFHHDPATEEAKEEERRKFQKEHPLLYPFAYSRPPRPPLVAPPTVPALPMSKPAAPTSMLQQQQDLSRLSERMGLEQIERENSGLLKNVRDSLLRIEGPPGEQKFAMGSMGPLLNATKAIVGESGKEYVLFPNGSVQLVDKAMFARLPAGSEVLTIAQARQMAGIHAIGQAETDFSRKEAYSERLNQPFNNANVRRLGQRGADYGFFQMNQTDVEEGVRLGMAPEVARHLHGGGKGGTSSVAEQSDAVLQYTKLRFPQQMNELAETGDFQKFRQSAAGGKWFALGREGGKVATAEYNRALVAHGPTAEDRSDVDRSVIDQALGDVGNLRKSKVKIGVDFGDMNAPDIPPSSVFKSVRLHREPQAGAAAIGGGDVNRFTG